MSDSDKLSWPQTPEGVTDWEVAFEDPDKGFIPLITQANSPAALRQSTIVVTEMLYTRQNDPAEVERFKAELIQMIPDDTAEENLPRITAAITGILGQIKDDRKQKAAESVKAKELGASGDGRRGEDRKKPASRGGPLRSPLAWGLALGTVGASVAGYLIFAGPSSQEQPSPTLVLIEQMKDVALGVALETHAFGGALRTGTRAGRPFITAEAIPPGACLSVAWVFVNRGTIIINGLMPHQISPPHPHRTLRYEGSECYPHLVPQAEEGKGRLSGIWGC